MLARGGEQHQRGAVIIAGLPDGLVHKHRCLGGNALDFLAEQEPCHVQIVDGHVAENAARALDIFGRRRTGIAGNDGNHLHLADLAGGDGGLHRLEMRIEAAVETDHQGRIGLVHDLKTILDPLDV